MLILQQTKLILIAYTATEGLFMKEPLFTGACTALVTPFLDDRVNYPMMEQLLRRQIDAGIKAVVICGTTGEAPTLSDSEKLDLGGIAWINPNYIWVPF